MSAPGGPGFVPRRILVTGAAGFVGGPMLAAMRAAFPAARLIAGARDETPAGADEAVPFDLFDAAGTRAIVRDTAPDAVIHLAALSAVSDSFADPDAVWRANVDGTRALAAAILAEAPSAVMLHASSAEAYGLSFKAAEPLDEDAPFRPANPYAASKAAADVALGEMALRGLRVIRMRPANHTGPGHTDRFVLPAFAKQVALIEVGKQEPVIRTGALDRHRDFLDVRDVCAAYATALAAADRLEPGAAFNVSSGTSREVGAILADLLRLAGVAARIETRQDALRPVDLIRAEMSSARIRDALGWAPRVPFEETLSRVLDHWRGEARAAG